MAGRKGLRGGVIGAVALGLAALGAPAQARQVDAATRDAAFAKLKRPDGIGGCIVLAMSRDLWRQALTNALAGQGPSAAFQSAVEIAAPRCTTHPYSRNDAPIIGATNAAVRRAAGALALAGEVGVGQDALDAAWAAAPAEEKAGYYAVADEFMAPGLSVTLRAPEALALAARAGVAADKAKTHEPRLRTYFLSTALRERAEAALAGTGK